jgi:hypothetical protein
MTLREALTATGCTCDPDFGVIDGELEVVHDRDCFWTVTEELDELRALTR